MKILPKGDKIVFLTEILLSLTSIKITRTTIERDLNTHPDYPSVLSISDVLSSYGVENLSFVCDKSGIEQIPTPFIAKIKNESNNGSELTIVRSVKSNLVSFYELETETWKNIEIEKFLSRWSTGMLMIIDPKGAVGERDYKKKRLEEQKRILAKLLLYLTIPLIAIISIVYNIIMHGSDYIALVGFATLALLGSFVTSILLWYEIDEYNPVLQQICSYGKKVNCTAVLNSKASKVFGISWSTIGFVYFTGQLLTLLTSGLFQNWMQSFFGWMTLCSSSYILFSLYYQWKIAKQWCVLCLLTQLILASQLFVVLTAKWLSINLLAGLSLVSIIPMVISYFMPLAVVISVIPAMKAKKENKANKAHLRRLRLDPQIFNSLLLKQKQITESVSGLGIELGNLIDPNVKIVKVCNPLCAPCSKSHTQLEALLENNPNVHLQIIFNSYENEYDKTAIPAKYLLALYSENSSIIKSALDDWYGADIKDYKLFTERYPISADANSQKDKIQAMRLWCDQMEIAHTPTFFINGFQLLSGYSVNDLKYFFSI